ncbi:glycoside hydrolase family 57 protein [Prochlorococcus sp. MIT 1223]|uniref:glycoside hydrolase family 57 protein n=1 Tax=Prochlorococcus sp. MIT 1223 TaxID=3096217 RepID=UPI002A749F32|nr:1,4-alpha-glucan branching protein domain-containing protein [Prochlorococcus sp. MIT 1223]
MSNGKLALVLHAHLPYVRSAASGSLEEDWFFQALMECYLPLLKTLEDASASKTQQPKITISLSPTLLSLLNDKELKNRFPTWLKARIKLLDNLPDIYQSAANNLKQTISTQLNEWQNCNGDIINRFAELQKLRVIDLLTCAATHGYLPLLRENPQAVLGQLKTAIREHTRLIGSPPLGIWLPECAYYEGLDYLMAKTGLKYAILDGHGVLHANPRPRYGLYAPICSKNGIAFFGRDSKSTLPVWSSIEGYPGHPEYREFHRDLGWDLSIEKLNEIGIQDQRPLGIKLHKVTGQKISLDQKKVYEPGKAKKMIKAHAKEYLQGRKRQLLELNKTMGIEPLLVAPFDAELFGHWWFEGPSFLSELFQQAKKEGIKFTRLIDQLSKTPKLQLCDPSPSSWGQGGYHNYWINESNSWIVPEWNKASIAMIKRSSIGVSNESDIKLLQQAARELLLAQSSDWSFILRAGTTTQLAKDRINKHLNRFWKLINAIEGKEALSFKHLSEIEKEDSLFPLIQASDWSEI